MPHLWQVPGLSDVMPACIGQACIAPGAAACDGAAGAGGGWVAQAASGAVRAPINSSVRVRMANRLWVRGMASA
jgi:hypothetical protein